MASTLAKSSSNLKNIHLSSNDRNSMFHYYMTLNKYFNNNKDNALGEDNDRSTSSRAVKARKRLLNLSTYQFFELTTDVNDEVERRMNTELNGEYLLPKENLHLKRNQARQKLANLSQKRFLDLVDDLSYEIRRRQYDLDPQFDSPFEEDIYDDDVAQVPTKPLRETEPITKPADLRKITNESREATTLEESNKNLTNKPIVQPVNVKTANLDWSDDEEFSQSHKPEEIAENSKPIEETDRKSLALPEGFSKRSLQIQSNNQNGLPTQDSTSHIALSVNPISKSSFIGDDLSILQRDLALQAANSSLASNSNGNESKLQGMIDDLNDKHALLLADHTNITKEHTILEDKYEKLLTENENLLNEFKVNEDVIQNLTNNLKSAEPSADRREYQAKIYTDMISKVEHLSIENETLKQKIMDLEIKDRLLDTVNDIKTNRFDEHDLSNFSKGHTLKDGIIPIASVEGFQNSVQSFYLTLQRYKQQDNNKNLFLEATKLCDIVANIVKVVEYHDNNQLFTENCILVNTTSTHLLTTLRYQSKFSDIFPKIIIQNALLEVVGGIYQLIYKAGCRLNEPSNVVINADGTESARQSALKLSNKNLSLLKSDSPVDIEDEESPVRPLKITQRLSSAPNLDDVIGSTSNANVASTNTNGSIRKHSNTGLFSGMLLTPSSNKPDNNPLMISTSNKNGKNMSLPLKDDSISSNNVTLTTPKKQNRTSSLMEGENNSNGTIKTTPIKSQGILNRVKAFEEQVNTSAESTPENGEVKDLAIENSNGHQRTPSKASLEISNLHKRNSLQSIEDRASAYGEFKHKPSNGTLGKDGNDDAEIPTEYQKDKNEEGTALKEEDEDLNNLLQYLENESIEVISTIQSLLTSIKNPNATIVDLKFESKKIMQVVNKVCLNAFSSIEKNNDLKTIGEYIITSLKDCERRMKLLIETDTGSEYPDKSFKQRLAGIAFDIAKNVKKLVKIVEELSLKNEIAHLDKQLV